MAPLSLLGKGPLAGLFRAEEVLSAKSLEIRAFDRHLWAQKMALKLDNKDILKKFASAPKALKTTTDRESNAEAEIAQCRAI